MRRIIIALAISIFSLNGFAADYIPLFPGDDYVDSVNYLCLANDFCVRAEEANKGKGLICNPAQAKKVITGLNSFSLLKQNNSSPKWGQANGTTNQQFRDKFGLLVNANCKAIAANVTPGVGGTTSNNGSGTGNSSTNPVAVVGPQVATVTATAVQNNQNGSNNTVDTSHQCNQGVVNSNCPGITNSNSTTTTTAVPLKPPVITTNADGTIHQVMEHSDGRTTVIDSDGNGNSITQNYKKDGKRDGPAVANDDIKNKISELPEKLQDKKEGRLKEPSSTEQVTDKGKGQEATATQQAAQADNQTLSDLTTALTTASTAIDTACVPKPPYTASANCTAIQSMMKNVLTIQIPAAEASQKLCTGASTKAHFICPMATNPQVQMAGVIMNGLAAVIPSMSSAAETCQVTSKANLVGQSIITLGVASCGLFKFACEGKCGKTIAALGQISTDIISMSTTASSDTDLAAVVGQLNAANDIALGKNKNNTALVTTCNGYKVDLGQMTATLAGMGAAAVQAKACEDKLSSAEGSGNGNSTMSVTEMCAQPANGNSIVCKCRIDNTGEGCPGHLSATLAQGNLNKNIGYKGVSAMAGGTPGKKNPSVGGLGDSLDISDEAKKALNANADSATDSGFSAAADASSGASGGGSSAAGAVAGKSKEEPKSLAGSFMSAIGSIFKGSASKPAASEKNDKLNSDKYKDNLKRQFASEQARSEISSSSGTDNWTKVKTRYKSNYSSLMAE